MKPLSIGPIALDNPFLLAPMAGYTDLAFRLLCREFGAALCCSEMISCEEVLAAGGKITVPGVTGEEELPVAVQLYGSDPEKMASAAAILCERPVSMIDINMGCPAPKIMAVGAGAALMDNPRLAQKIIAAVCRQSSLPVTVKTRSGKHQHSITAPAFAMMAEDAGAQAITIHARTLSEGFSGPADLQVLTDVKKAVSIPVIGNGGIRCYEEGRRMLQKTGCDGVMIGRAALGAPWIFAPGTNPHPSMRFRARALLRHLQLIALYHPGDYPLAKIKNHAWKYVHEQPNSKTMRQRIASAASFEALNELVVALL